MLSFTDLTVTRHKACGAMRPFNPETEKGQQWKHVKKYISHIFTSIENTAYPAEVFQNVNKHSQK